MRGTQSYSNSRLRAQTTDCQIDRRHLTPTGMSLANSKSEDTALHMTALMLDSSHKFRGLQDQPHFTQTSWLQVWIPCGLPWVQ